MTQDELLKKIPKMAQRQDSASDQISDLLMVASKLGMYDARDWILQAIQDRELPSKQWNHLKRCCH